MPGPAKLQFLETTRWRLILLAPVFALMITILAIKAYSEGWFEVRHALDLHQQPAVLFFNRQKGCECAMRVYQAAKEQVQHWPGENRQGVQLIQIDLDRRPDLGEQFNVIRAPSLLLIGSTGQIIYRQDEVVTDAVPLDLSIMEKEIGGYWVKNQAGIMSLMNKIELLYFDGCPSWQTALANLRQVIEAENLDVQIHLIEVTSPQQVQDERFLGSPSFRLNGVDLWPETRARYNMSCRVYQTNQGMRGSPNAEMLREKIQALLTS